MRLVIILILLPLISWANPEAIEGLYQKYISARGPQKTAAALQLSKALAGQKLLQTAAFPLLQIIKTGTPADKKRVLSPILYIADQLEDPSLLEFVVKKISPQELDKAGRQVLYLRQAEQTADIQKAHQITKLALEENPQSDDANYSMGVILLKLKKPTEAYPYFEKLYNKLKRKRGSSRQASMALLGMARALYQGQRWNDAADTYRQIPKSNPFYRESLMELSWSLFRAGKLRSALSPLQSLETPFYENFYQPEPLLLHGIIVLFSCQYQDAFASYESFQKNYIPALAKLQSWSQAKRTTADLAQEIDFVRQGLRNISRTGQLESKNTLPFFVLRTILEESDVAMELRYQDRLLAEKELIAKLFKKKRGLAAYSERVLKLRNKASRYRVAVKAQRHISRKIEELQDFSAQFDFLNYEALNGVRMSLKGKLSQSPEATVDTGDKSRDFYVQNGYRFWPAQGEYWRDEIGSYQYVGEYACAKN